MLYVSQGARDTLGPSPAIVLTFSGKQGADVRRLLKTFVRIEACNQKAGKNVFYQDDADL